MKAAIFDMDGTLVDNMMVHHRAWQRVLAKLGLPLDLEEVRQRIHGINEEILKRIFEERFSAEERKKISAEKEAEYREIFIKDLKLIEGADVLFDQLKSEGTPMAIASAAPVENVDFVLDNLDIRSYFSEIFHAGSVSKGKPHPEIYLKTADALGLAPKDCLVFEDTPTGAKAASAAGCASVIITTTHEPDEFSGIEGILTFTKNYSELDLKSILA